MKTLSLIVILSLGVLVMTVLLVPVGVQIDVVAYPGSEVITMGQHRVGEIHVQNQGWFTQHVELPEITGCIGDQEVPLDAWTSAGEGIVRGVGQQPFITLRPGESGVIYLVASDASLYDSMQLYRRTPHFSCLTAGTPITER